MIVPGMSHALPITLWPKNIGAIDKHAHGQKAKAHVDQYRAAPAILQKSRE